MSEESLNSVFYNPYIPKTDHRISISTMLKTSIILTKALSDGCLAPYQDYTALDPESKNKAFSDLFASQSLPVIVKVIGGIAQFVIYKLGMVICKVGKKSTDSFFRNLFFNIFIMVYFFLSKA